MRSRQINFFYKPDEFPLILEWIKKYNLNILPKTKFSASLEYLESVDLKNNKHLELVFDQDLSKIEYRHIEARDCYLFDIDKSNSIELRLSLYDNATYTAARFYWTPFFYSEEGNILVHKSSEFQDKASACLRDFVKNNLFKGDETHGWFVTKGILNCLSSGKLKWDSTYNSIRILM